MIESQVEATVGVRGAVARQIAGEPSTWKRNAGLTLRRVHTCLGCVAPDKACKQLVIADIKLVNDVCAEAGDR
jgi:hypothetical protein